MKLYPVSIMTADKMIYEGSVLSLNVPAGLGFMGILADHVPLLSTITPGKIVLKKEPAGPEQTIVSLGKGFLEISRKGVTILLDSIQE